MSLTIVLIDSHQSTLDDLSKAFLGIPDIDFAKVDNVRYTSPPTGLDAIFLLLPAAERWGSRPISGKAQLLRTTSEDREKGMPPFVITGIVLGTDDPRGPIPETRLLVATAIEATREFNASSSGEKIKRLGFWVIDLLKGVSPSQLAQIFRDISLTTD